MTDVAQIQTEPPPPGHPTVRLTLFGDAYVITERPDLTAAVDRGEVVGPFSESGWTLATAERPDGNPVQLRELAMALALSNLRLVFEAHDVEGRKTGEWASPLTHHQVRMVQDVARVMHGTEVLG